jgi:hypothetical protein
MEKRNNVDQRRQHLLRFINQRAGLLARQGTIVGVYRTRSGKRTGPYFFLAFRESGRQRRIYLGCEERLICEIRILLGKIQEPLRRERFLKEQEKIVRRAYACHKAKWREELAEVGLRLHGNEVRGSMRLARLRMDSTPLGKRACHYGDNHD